MGGRFIPLSALVLDRREASDALERSENHSERRLCAALLDPLVVARAFNGGHEFFDGRALRVAISQRPDRPTFGRAQVQGAPCS